MEVGAAGLGPKHQRLEERKRGRREASGVLSLGQVLTKKALYTPDPPKARRKKLLWSLRHQHWDEPLVGRGGAATREHEAPCRLESQHPLSGSPSIPISPPTAPKTPDDTCLYHLPRSPQQPQDHRHRSLQLAQKETHNARLGLGVFLLTDTGKGAVVMETAKRDRQNVSRIL